ncbi:sigma-70 family RNA polymerase sigma factor [bacterium]|nr:sigma-70 family RNA polymerase sigma factor [bacterium]
MTELKTSELEKLEELISGFKSENDSKKKHVLYLHLIEETLKLVKKIASGMIVYSGSVPRDDLIQVGAIGALKAIDTYHAAEKGSFKTYATKFIKGRILQYLRDKSNIVKPPRETIANISLVNDAIEKLSENTDSIPSVEEIARYTGLPEGKVTEIMNIDLIRNIVSLDQNIYASEGGETLLDRVQGIDEGSYEHSYENKKMIEFALNKLQKQEKEVIYKYYIEGITKRDIAAELGVSPTQVARIIKRALNKMYEIITKDIKED